jgi:hypothetical protein
LEKSATQLKVATTQTGNMSIKRSNPAAAFTARVSGSRSSAAVTVWVIESAEKPGAN